MIDIGIKEKSKKKENNINKKLASIINDIEQRYKKINLHIAEIKFKCYTDEEDGSIEFIWKCSIRATYYIDNKLRGIHKCVKDKSTEIAAFKECIEGIDNHLNDKLSKIIAEVWEGKEYL